MQDVLKTLFLPPVLTMAAVVVLHRLLGNYKRASWLMTIFTIRLLFVFIVFYFGWRIKSFNEMPGYDAAGFYVSAGRLLKNGFSTEGIGINHSGIYFYLAILFLLFGYNPVSYQCHSV